MPKAQKTKGLQGKRPVHPNSRLAAKLSRKEHRDGIQDKKYKEKSQKIEALGEKLVWFHENHDETVSAYTKQETVDLVQHYLGRFDEELEQIELVNSIGKRQGTQHAARRDAINRTLERERREFETCGIEIPDLMNGKNLKTFREWSGELRYIQNLKLRKITKPAVSSGDNAKTADRSVVADGDHTKSTDQSKTDSVSEDEGMSM